MSTGPYYSGWGMAFMPGNVPVANAGPGNGVQPFAIPPSLVYPTSPGLSPLASNSMPPIPGATASTTSGTAAAETTNGGAGTATPVAGTSANQATSSAGQTGPSQPLRPVDVEVAALRQLMHDMTGELIERLFQYIERHRAQHPEVDRMVSLLSGATDDYQSQNYPSALDQIHQLYRHLAVARAIQPNFPQP
jgi:hypothetical protein